MKFSIVRTEYALTLPSVWCEPSLFALFIALSLVLLLVLSFLLLVFRLRFPLTGPIINIHIPATRHLPCTDKSVLTTRVGCLRLCIVSITLGQDWIQSWRLTWTSVSKSRTISSPWAPGRWIGCCGLHTYSRGPPCVLLSTG